MTLDLIVCVVLLLVCYLPYQFNYKNIRNLEVEPGKKLPYLVPLTLGVFLFGIYKIISICTLLILGAAVAIIL